MIVPLTRIRCVSAVFHVTVTFVDYCCDARGSWLLVQPCECTQISETEKKVCGTCNSPKLPRISAGRSTYLNPSVIQQILRAHVSGAVHWLYLDNGFATGFEQWMVAVDWIRSCGPSYGPSWARNGRRVYYHSESMHACGGASFFFPVSLWKHDGWSTSIQRKKSFVHIRSIQPLNCPVLAFVGVPRPKVWACRARPATESWETQASNNICI